MDLVATTADASTRLCPYCAEPIKNEAIRCKHCRSDLITQSKNPGLAALLSFFVVGLGQIYNGKIWTGLTALALFAASLFVVNIGWEYASTRMLEGLSVFLFLAIAVGVHITNVLDAYKNYSGKNRPIIACLKMGYAAGVLWIATLATLSFCQKIEREKAEKAETEHEATNPTGDYSDLLNAQPLSDAERAASIQKNVAKNINQNKPLTGFGKPRTLALPARISSTLPNSSRRSQLNKTTTTPWVGPTASGSVALSNRRKFEEMPMPQVSPMPMAAAPRTFAPLAKPSYDGPIMETSNAEFGFERIQPVTGHSITSENQR